MALLFYDGSNAVNEIFNDLGAVTVETIEIYKDIIRASTNPSAHQQMMDNHDLEVCDKMLEICRKHE